MSDCMVEKYMPGLSFEEQKQYAQEFSEGDKNLQELLLYLWKHRINTYACCKGHEDQSRGYIFFCCDDFTQKQLESLLQNIFNAQLSLNAEFSKTFRVTLENQKVKELKPIEGYVLSDASYLYRNKMMSIYMPQDANFSELLKCFKAAFAGESKSSYQDRQIKLALKLMYVDLTKQKYADVLDYIGLISIYLNSDEQGTFSISPYVASSKEFYEKALKESKYKAICSSSHVGRMYYFLQDGKLWDTVLESRLKVFQSLNITDSEIKCCNFDLTEREVENFEKQIFN